MTTPARLVLLGHPVGHSLSPTFQDAALRAAHIHLRYEAMDVPPESLEWTLLQAREGDWAGNVTVPHKEAVFSRCTALTPVAQRVGAVNCFRASRDALVGHNTDVDGVRSAVIDLLGGEPQHLEFGVVGAGGAAAAVLAAIETWPGCRAVVANRGAERRRALVARFSSIAREGDASEITSRADVVVNATSLGLSEGDALPIDPRALRADAAVLDLVYSPMATRLVREAAGRGLRARDGLSMLVSQGAAAFAWWFGVTPDVDLMWRSLGRQRP